MRAIVKITPSRIGVAVAAVALLIGFVLLRGRSRPVESASPAVATDEPDSSPRRASREYPIEAVAPKVQPPPVEADQPIVDEVTVDKTAVCRGEENFVNVKAHTSNGSDAFLAVHFVDPTTHRVLSGRRIPFRLEEMPDRLLEVIVEGKGGTARIAQLPHVEVKDCEVPRTLTIETVRVAERPDRLAFAARVRERPADTRGSSGAQPMTPTSYHWDFGDDTRSSTPGAEAEHNYEGRDQSTAQSTFVVTVTARDAAGNEVTGSRSVDLPNVGFLPLVTENRVAISVGVREANAATGAHEQIWLYHGYSAAVRIDRVRVRETVLDASDQPERETMARDYAPDGLLGFSELPRGQSVTASDLTALQPSAETAVRYVEVIGHAVDGRPARGTFTLLPPKAPIAAN